MHFVLRGKNRLCSRYGVPPEPGRGRDQQQDNGYGKDRADLKRSNAEGVNAAQRDDVHHLMPGLCAAINETALVESHRLMSRYQSGGRSLARLGSYQLRAAKNRISDVRPWIFRNQTHSTPPKSTLSERRAAKNGSG